MNITPYLKLMADKGASDLFFTTGAPVSMKIEGHTKAVGKSPLEPGLVKQIAESIMSEEQKEEFAHELEMNLGLSLTDIGRFRINIYLQRGEVSMVIRYIKAVIPSLEELNLPDTLKELILLKKGLILVVGSTGSGKSTTLASMINYRNKVESGHILTIEDPIEFAFNHEASIVGQREVGLDTKSYANALREAMREAPDVIMIGEARDEETMKAALSYADTGHLCLTTLHSVNANQTLDRVLSFFSNDAANQVLMDMSLNLKAIVSQRLIQSRDGKRVAAVEILINTPYISDLIRKSNFGDIKDAMEKNGAEGMQTFDQSLYELFKSGKIDLKSALNNADSRSNLEWRINFGGEKGINKIEESGEMEFPSSMDDLPEVD
ncbi:MAG: PilT/PilU family type 4a pilus ATPase [Gammaproteobacteria bacterium]|nr:PilT/PilU family type 4a pilus ATPase [Gammaproteobacteria bacterium]